MNSKEILMVVDAVSAEKGVEKEIIFEAIEAAVRDGAERCDALLTSGGVSIGDFDYVKAVLGRIKTCVGCRSPSSPPSLWRSVWWTGSRCSGFRETRCPRWFPTSCSRGPA